MPAHVRPLRRAFLQMMHWHPSRCIVPRYAAPALPAQVEEPWGSTRGSALIQEKTRLSGQGTPLPGWLAAWDERLPVHTRSASSPRSHQARLTILPARHRSRTGLPLTLLLLLQADRGEHARPGAGRDGSLHAMLCQPVLPGGSRGAAAERGLAPTHERTISEHVGACRATRRAATRTSRVAPGTPPPLSTRIDHFHFLLADRPLSFSYSGGSAPGSGEAEAVRQGAGALEQAGGSQDTGGMARRHGWSAARHGAAAQARAAPHRWVTALGHAPR